MWALSFPTGSDRLNIGSGADIDNMATGTILAWVHTGSGAPSAAIYSKGASTRILFRFVTNWQRLTFDVFRTSAPHLSVEAGSMPGLRDNAWGFVVMSWKASGGNTDQKLYSGSETVLAAEPASYIVQTVGGGAAQADDSADDGILGGRAGGTNPLTRPMGFFAIYDRQLTLPEIRAVQTERRVLPGCLGQYRPGRTGRGTVPDESGKGRHAVVVGSPTLALGVPWLVPASLSALLNPSTAPSLPGSVSWRQAKRTRALAALMAMRRI